MQAQADIEDEQREFVLVNQVYDMSSEYYNATLGADDDEFFEDSIFKSFVEESLCDLLGTDLMAKGCLQASTTAYMVTLLDSCTMVESDSPDNWCDL